MSTGENPGKKKKKVLLLARLFLLAFTFRVDKILKSNHQPGRYQISTIMGLRSACNVLIPVTGHYPKNSNLNDLKIVTGHYSLPKSFTPILQY